MGATALNIVEIDAKYTDILTLLKERTESLIQRFNVGAHALHVYEGTGTARDVTRHILDTLEKQRVDLEYLLSRGPQAAHRTA